MATPLARSSSVLAVLFVLAAAGGPETAWAGPGFITKLLAGCGFKSAKDKISTWEKEAGVDPAAVSVAGAGGAQAALEEKAVKQFAGDGAAAKIKKKGKSILADAQKGNDAYVVPIPIRKDANDFSAIEARLKRYPPKSALDKQVVEDARKMFSWTQDTEGFGKYLDALAKKAIGKICKTNPARCEELAKKGARLTNEEVMAAAHDAAVEMGVIKPGGALHALEEKVVPIGDFMGEIAETGGFFTDPGFKAGGKFGDFHSENSHLLMSLYLQDRSVTEGLSNFKSYSDYIQKGLTKYGSLEASAGDKFVSAIFSNPTLASKSRIRYLDSATGQWATVESAEVLGKLPADTKLMIENGDAAHEIWQGTWDDFGAPNSSNPSVVFQKVKAAGMDIQ